MCKARPLVVDVDDPGYGGPGVCLGEMDYEAFLAAGDPAYVGSAPEDEWDAIALNYTSGTTGSPKGVVYPSPRSLSRRTSEMRSSPAMQPALRGLFWTARCFIAMAGASPGHGGACRHRRVPARVEAAAILALIVSASRYPLRRGAHRAQPAAQRPGRTVGRGVTHEVEGYITGAAPPLAVIAAWRPWVDLGDPRFTG